MGAKWSVDGTYTLGEQLKFENKLWKIYPAESRTDGVSATVFIHEKEKDENIYGIEKAVKYLRTLRHPGLLKCHEVFDNTDELSVVTEAIVPLENVIGELNTQEIIAGIHGIITTVTFLHKCKLSHNNLCLGSIFVGQNDASWKIAGFECMLTFTDMTSEFLTQIKPFRELESIPPEEDKIQLEWAHTQDSFGLGKLISDTFHEIDTTEEPTIDNFQLRVEAELLHPNYQERPQVSFLLNDSVFQNGYIDILEFLNNITIKSNEEKALFFRDLHNKLQYLPPKMVANRLLHLLLSRLVLVDPVAVEVFLPHLLTPLSDKPYGETDLTNVSPLLPHELYKESCLPILRKLFDVKDRHVRMILLKYFHLYVSMFEKDVLQKVILHELMLGLRDSDDELVSSTFSALQHLVPLLGSKIVIGGERIQQFTERRPKIEDLESKSMPCPKDQFNKMTLVSKAKQVKSKTVEDKIMDREKRREETRKRNEERRKQNQLLQIQKLKAKKANEVEEVHYESDNDFEAWEELSPEREQNFEVSDGSEHGRPSSSENLSLDSGFSERIRIPSSNPVLPRSLSNKTQGHFQTNTVDKSPAGVKGGMKLGKAMGKSKKESNQIHANLSTSNCDVERKMADKNKRTKNISSKSLDKKKTIHAPWEDYEMKVGKKNLREEEDLFADMAPSLLCAPTAPVKGTSIYSDKLAVESHSNEAADGWNDEEW